MNRIHLFEIEDFQWFPHFLRKLVTDYLQFVVSRFNLYSPIIGKLKEALESADSQTIIDLGSGSSGPIIPVLNQLEEFEDYSVRAILTDKYPHKQMTTDNSHGLTDKIVYHNSPVDAIDIPKELSGFRTFFNAFHHFRPNQAQKILLDTIGRQEGIGIFELTGRHPVTLLMILLSPVAVLIFTPFIRPFTWKRLLFTYLIPIVPFIAVWDGTISNLRTYSPNELRNLVLKLNNPNYLWDIGRKKTRIGLPITYLVGYPKQKHKH